MNYLIKMMNGSGATAAELPFDPAKIQQVWTVLDEEKLFTQFDPQTGQPKKVDLQEVKPRHWHSAFLEDRVHDWAVHKGVFNFYAHSSEVGSRVTLLVVVGQ